MRLSILTSVAVAGLVLAPDAHAQYANRSFGVGLSVNNAIEPALTLEGSVYIESGFDIYLRIPLTILSTPSGAATVSGSGQVYGTGASLGVRYLFLEERIRPYVGLQISTQVLFTQPLVDYYFGPGATVGCDFFVTDFLSLGVRGSYDMFVDLNRPLRHNFSGGISVTTIF
jgi:outer membrane protein